MGIKRTLAYTVSPAAVGAVASLFNEMSMLEGAREAVLAGLPAAAIMSSPSQEAIDRAFDLAADHPYFTAVGAAGLGVAAYLLGGLGMECLTNQDLNQGFTATVGALEGALGAMTCTLIGKRIRTW